MLGGIHFGKIRGDTISEHQLLGEQLTFLHSINKSRPPLSMNRAQFSGVSSKNDKIKIVSIEIKLQKKCMKDG